MSRRVAINPSRNLKFRVRGKTGWSMPMFNASVLISNHSSLDLSSFRCAVSRADKASTLLFALLSDNFGDWSIVDTDSLLEKTLFNMHSEKYIQKVCNCFANPRALYHASPFSVADMSSRNDIITYYILEQTVCWKFSSSIVLGRVGEGMLNQ